MSLLFKPNNPIPVPSSISVSAFHVIPSMSWCPSGVQYSAALSADFNYRRYSIVMCAATKGGDHEAQHRAFSFGLAVCGWNAYGGLLCELGVALPLLWASYPVQGVQPRSWMVFPDAFCVSQVAIDSGVFCTGLSPCCGRPLLSLFSSIPIPSS